MDQHKINNRGPLSWIRKLVNPLTVLCLVLALSAACSSPEDSSTSENAGVGGPLWRYVNSAWVTPHDAEQTDAFAQELRAFVITSQEELDQYNGGFNARLTQGTTTSLGRIDFLESVLVAAYYIWRPVQGNPLSVVGFSLDEGQATVDLELEDLPQGRARPYLMAPMTMVAMDRSIFPSGQPIMFTFQVNGEPAALVVATIE